MLEEGGKSLGSVLSSIRRRGSGGRVEGGGEREGGVSAQSQGRGHGEGGGVQYQTLNSEIEEVFGEDELGSNMQIFMSISHKS